MFLYHITKKSNFKNAKVFTKLMETPAITTEFNSNMLRLLSLNRFLDECVEYSRMCFFNGHSIEYLKLWNHTLKAVFLEVKPKFEKKSKEEKKILSLFREGKKIGSVYDFKPTPDGKVKVINLVKFREYWNLLHSIESELRVIADKRGMLMTNKVKEYDVIGEE